MKIPWSKLVPINLKASHNYICTLHIIIYIYKIYCIHCTQEQWSWEWKVTINNQTVQKMTQDVSTLVKKAIMKYFSMKGNLWHIIPYDHYIYSLFLCFNSYCSIIFFVFLRIPWYMTFQFTWLVYWKFFSFNVLWADVKENIASVARSKVCLIV